MTFVIITFTLDTSISYLRVILCQHLKSSPFSISIWASYFTYFSHGRILFFVTCEFLTLYFVVFLFVISFTLLITLSCLVITLCLLSKIFSLLSQFESGVLLISPLAIFSSSPRVSLDITPFFVVLIPLTLMCLCLFPYALVYYRLWPLRYLCLLPKFLPWTYPLKASPLFWPDLRAVSYLSLPWFLFTPCRITSLVLIPSFDVSLFAITITFSSIDLTLTLIFMPALQKSPLFHLNLRVAIYLSGPWTYPLLFYL